ncbi:ABC transporter related [Actinosynnema mirum DSM 43827]|uniref:ABC transporter related n=1 Tax=Actinosynnema mirum (strain ATCC 29888 / DSM 43827 / JCM 3225 / NBRC 14064 / NCIMB 13271 / NRRL B-12336 / IMRU 3971 / 101) TaxID=446462 RepID=C6WPA9_ACTMD|nr:ABC transporter related [Actinosynnema mirum DSM 43827]
MTVDLNVDSLTVELSGRAIVDAITFDVEPGTVVGLVGPNGSGKSTVLRCVYRALRPSRGVVRVGGADLDALSARDRARRIGALTQNSTGELDFTTEEVVALGRSPHLRGNAPLTAADRALCDEAMRQVGVDHLRGRGVLSLSGGEWQRVLIARALAQQPEVLVLDEPTNHLDLRHQLDLLRLLRSSGLTVLVVLHDLNLAAAACDRLCVLSHGELVASGTPAEVLTESLLSTVFGVRAAIVEHPVDRVPQVLHSLSDHPEGTP